MLKGKLVKMFALLLVLGLFGAGMLSGCATEDDNGDEDAGFTGEIIGIDPGAGLMSLSEKVIEEYGLDVTLIEGSDATMVAALDDAISRNEWIIVTGWAPHWKFAEYDLKILEDPKKVLGGEEVINTIARLGLEADAPEAYHVLKHFAWSDAEIGEVMNMNKEGGDPADNARTWVDNNQDKVAEWLPADYTTGDKGDFTLLYVEWECALASTFVVAAVLEDLGYNVETLSVAAALMYESLAAGDGDAMTTAWLPGTHGHYLEEHGDNLDIVGTSYTGAVLGWIVPSYVTINSIEEINDYIK